MFDFSELLLALCLVPMQKENSVSVAQTISQPPIPQPGEQLKEICRKFEEGCLKESVIAEVRKAQAILTT